MFGRVPPKKTKFTKREPKQKKHMVLNKKAMENVKQLVSKGDLGVEGRWSSLSIEEKKRFIASNPKEYERWFLIVDKNNKDETDIFRYDLPIGDFSYVYREALLDAIEESKHLLNPREQDLLEKKLLGFCEEPLLNDRAFKAAAKLIKEGRVERAKGLWKIPSKKERETFMKENGPREYEKWFFAVDRNMTDAKDIDRYFYPYGNFRKVYKEALENLYEDGEEEMQDRVAPLLEAIKDLED
ncbi:MAG: hypothetical protein JSR76_06515 [Verrucomicrobia bacterium]|nr:hypothetical protein [Verrucomicrobiota bacterium]